MPPPWSPSPGVKLGDKAEKTEEILLLMVDLTLPPLPRQANSKSCSEALVPHQPLPPYELPFAPRTWSAQRCWLESKIAPRPHEEVQLFCCTCFVLIKSLFVKKQVCSELTEACLC